MSKSQLFRAIWGVGLGIAMFASAVQAQPEDKRTFFTFSGPIALPGVTLPAGRYIFRIVDTTTSRKVIQVTSEDQKKPYAMMNTIPDTRRDPAKDATVAFYETAKGTPAAVKSWWYPGERDGYQFIYPRAQAKMIAKGTTTPVLTTKNDTSKSDDTKSGALTHVDANGRDTDADAAASQSASNQRDETSTVFNRTPSQTEGVDRTPPQQAQANPAPVPTQSSRVARNELPRTASNLPLAGLIGALSLFGFASLRFGRAARS